MRRSIFFETVVFCTLLAADVKCTCKVKEYKGIQVHDRHPFSDLTNIAGIDASTCSQRCCQRLDCVAFFHTTNQLNDAGNCNRNEPCCWLKPSFNETRLDDYCEEKDSCISGVCDHSQGPNVTISNTKPRLDTAGKIMDAHDSKIIHLNGLYYWFAASYGECKEPKGENGCSNVSVGNCGFKTNHNVTLFTSSDLVTWTNAGKVFGALGNLPKSSVLFAPKTVYNRKTNEFVMWFNYIIGDFSHSYYGVAASKSAYGPFEVKVPVVNTTRYQDNGDENLFVDDNGEGYLIYTSIANNHGISIERLSHDFYLTLGAQGSSGIFGERISEAPMMFKRKGIYYAVFGACCCYCGNGSEVNVYSSGHVLGPYEKRTSLGQLHSQSTDIFKYIDAGGEEQFMYVGDHWQSSPDGLKGHDFTVWAKLLFSPDGLEVTTHGFQDEFQVEVGNTAKFHTLPVHLHYAIPEPGYIHSSIVKKLTSKNHHNFPQGGNIWPVAIYWTFIEVGTPPIRFAVNVDSGSSNLDIEGIGCIGCNPKLPNNAYDPQQSSTSKRGTPPTFSNSYLTCDLKNMTARCTVSGDVYEDEVSIGSLGPVRVQFGSIKKMTSNSDQWKVITGVMGFIGDGNRNVFAQLVKNNIVKPIFAICFNNNGTKSNGTLTLGGVDPNLYLGTMKYVPRKGHFFGVDVKSFTIGTNDTAVASLTRQAILDSGTNILLLPDEGFASMKKHFLDICHQNATKLPGICVESGRPTLFDGECFELKPRDISKFPSFHIQLENNVSLAMHSEDYLLKGDVRAGGNSSLYCLAIRGTGPNGYFIIGDTLMRNYYLVFDNEKDRIGWATVNKKQCGEIPY